MKKKIIFISSLAAFLALIALGYQNCTQRSLTSQPSSSSTGNPTPTPSPDPNSPRTKSYTYTGSTGAVWNAEVTLTQATANEVTFRWSGSSVTSSTSVETIEEINNILFTFNTAQSSCQQIYYKSGKSTDGQTIYITYLHGCYDPARKSLTIRHHAEATQLIVVAHSGKCLEIPNDSTANGTVIRQATCATKSHNNRQAWVASAVFQGTSSETDILEIYSPLGATSFLSGKCLDVEGEKTTEDENIILHDCHAGGNQRFHARPTGDGYYNLVALHSDKCLDLEGAKTDDGIRLMQHSCNGGPNQKFQFTNLVPLRAQVHTTLVF